MNGTARRLKGALVDADGRAIEIGGKTGTGDHRYEVSGRSGQVIAERKVGRSATFVFMIGDRYFGTIVAYVREPYAGALSLHERAAGPAAEVVRAAVAAGSSAQRMQRQQRALMTS